MTTPSNSAVEFELEPAGQEKHQAAGERQVPENEELEPGIVGGMSQRLEEYNIAEGTKEQQGCTSFSSASRGGPFSIPGHVLEADSETQASEKSNCSCEKSVEECRKVGEEQCNAFYSYVANLSTTIGALKMKKRAVISRLNDPSPTAIPDIMDRIMLEVELDNVEERVNDIRRMQDSAEVVEGLVDLVHGGDLEHNDLHVAFNILTVFTHPKLAAKMECVGDEMKEKTGEELLNFFKESPEGIELYGVIMGKLKQLEAGTPDNSAEDSEED